MAKHIFESGFVSFFFQFSGSSPVAHFTFQTQRSNRNSNQTMIFCQNTDLVISVLASTRCVFKGKVIIHYTHSQAAVYNGCDVSFSYHKTIRAESSQRGTDKILTALQIFYGAVKCYTELSGLCHNIL